MREVVSMGGDSAQPPLERRAWRRLRDALSSVVARRRMLFADVGGGGTAAAAADGDSESEEDEAILVRETRERRCSLW